MSRTPVVVCLFAAAITAGCTRNPSAPTPPDAAAAEATPTSAAKPGPAPAPTPSPHTVAFGPVAQDTDGLDPGHIDTAGPESATGWITGSSTTGNILANASASAFTITVTDATPLPPELSGGNPCTAGEKDILRAAGVLGADTHVTGALTFNVDQDGDPRSGSIPLVTWRLDSVQSGSDVWVLGGNSTVNYRPVITGDPTALTVTLEAGKIFFERHPNGAKKSDLLVGCRVDFTMSMTPQ